MNKFLIVFTLVFAQIVLGQITIPLQSKCGCLELSSTPNSNFAVTNNVGYQNLAKHLAVGNTGGLLVSNGLPVINMPVTNAILDGMSITNMPIANNVQVPLAQRPVCHENTASMAITSNNPRINFGGIGSVANIANGGGLGNIGVHFVPKYSTVNVPVRLRRNIQQNNMFHDSLCNSGITYDSTLLTL